MYTQTHRHTPLFIYILYTLYIVEDMLSIEKYSVLLGKALQNTLSAITMIPGDQILLASMS